MTMTGIFILTTIVSAFTIFGVVLAWGEYQTRYLGGDAKQSHENNLRGKQETAVRVKFDQPTNASRKSLEAA